MTDVTENRDQAGAELSAADEQVLRELTERARAGGLKLTGEGGLLGRLTKMVVEGALEGELDDHLGYSKHDPAGRNGGNSRNGYREKTVITEAGPVELSVPRDRDASFEPVIVAVSNRGTRGMQWLCLFSANGAHRLPVDALPGRPSYAPGGSGRRCGRRGAGSRPLPRRDFRGTCDTRGFGA